MPVQINGRKPSRIVLNGKKVKSIYLNGHLVYTTDIQPNQIFSTIPTSANDSISISNGLETKSFKALGSDVDSFIAQGSANEVLSFKDHKSNEEWTFESGSAPSLIKETVGSYALNFIQGQKSSNGIVFKGNLIVAIFERSEITQGTLLNSHNNGFKYMFGYDNSNFGSVYRVPIKRMFIEKTYIYGAKRFAVFNAITNKYGIVIYDVDLNNNDEWHISKYVNSTWDFSGRLKEISCYTIADDTDIIKIVDQIKARHNIT